MKNNKGQALVEFVLIMPIIMMILCVIIDFSTIFYKKNQLEGVLNDTTEYISRKKDKTNLNTFINNDKIKVNLKTDKDMLTITLKEDITLVTPFSETFFSNPYTISAERTILNE